MNRESIAVLVAAQIEFIAKSIAVMHSPMRITPIDFRGALADFLSDFH